MSHIGLTTTVFLFALLGGTPAAYALTSEQGQNVSGDHANVADPDDQVPNNLKPPDDQRAGTPSFQLNANGGSPT